jgi:hypothetical protein
MGEIKNPKILTAEAKSAPLPDDFWKIKKDKFNRWLTISALKSEYQQRGITDINEIKEDLYKNLVGLAWAKFYSDITEMCPDVNSENLDFWQTKDRFHMSGIAVPMRNRAHSGILPNERPIHNPFSNYATRSKNK